jgi:hypothetical protein
MFVKAIVDCFVDGHLRKAGERFEYKGPKNENLQAVKETVREKLENVASEVGEAVGEAKFDE